MLPLLSLLVLRARDLDVTVDFYRGLGLEFQQEQHGTGPVHYSCLWGDLVLEIYPRKAGQSDGDDATMLGLRVASLEAVLEKLDVSAEIKTGEWGHFCNLKDPDGRVVRLTQENDV